MPVGGNLWDQHMSFRVASNAVRFLSWLSAAEETACRRLSVLRASFSRAWAENEPEEPTQGTNTVRDLRSMKPIASRPPRRPVKIAGSELVQAQLLPWRAIALLTLVPMS
jgi:hypothetical protein